MSAFDETDKYLRLYYPHLFKNNNNFFLKKYPFYKKDDYWLVIFMNDLCDYNDLNKLLIYFLKIKNKKILDDFKKNINMYQVLDNIYKNVFSRTFIIEAYDTLKNLIFLGANVNSDILLNFDINTIDYLKNSMNELDKIKYKNYLIDKSIIKLKELIEIEENKIKCYNLIREAYYAQKINRFIKYYYDDKYQLTPFRIRLEKNKYLRLIKEKIK